MGFVRNLLSNFGQTPWFSLNVRKVSTNIGHERERRSENANHREHPRDGTAPCVDARQLASLGGRDAIDKALQRLAKAGELRRINRGLYDRPRINALTENRLRLWEGPVSACKTGSSFGCWSMA